MTLMVFLLMIACFAVAQPGDTDAQRSDSSDTAQIVERAALAVGVRGRVRTGDSLAFKIALVEGADVPAPDFLIDSVAGRKVWRVDFDDVLIREVKSDSGTMVELRRTITAYLDSLSGKLIMVQSIRPSDRVISDQEMPPAERERTLLNTGAFRGLPHSVVLDFVSALQHCPYSPHLAERIAGVYIYRIGKSSPDLPIPVWHLSLVGIPPWRPGGMAGMCGPVPEHMINAAYVVIDGWTGRLLWRGN